MPPKPPSALELFVEAKGLKGVPAGQRAARFRELSSEERAPYDDQVDLVLWFCPAVGWPENGPPASQRLAAWRQPGGRLAAAREDGLGATTSSGSGIGRWRSHYCRNRCGSFSRQAAADHSGH